MKGLCWEISCILAQLSVAACIETYAVCIMDLICLLCLLACLLNTFLCVFFLPTFCLLAAVFSFFFFFSIFFAYSHFVTLLAKLVRPALIAKKLKKRHILK